MSYEAKILADSVSAAGHRLTTFLVTFPRIVLAELNTHKMLSKNSASSRAIPVMKRIDAIKVDPFVPEAFGKNQPGMQSSEKLDEETNSAARLLWMRALESACIDAQGLAALEVHKQLANRLLEPFSWHTAILSGTDWDNLWHLRDHPAAQGELSRAVRMMRELYVASMPARVAHGEWHAPLAFDSWKSDHVLDWSTIARLSAGRCARVSYNTHDAKSTPEKDLARYEKLASAGHASPLEHPARPMEDWELRAFEQIEGDFLVDGQVRTMRVSAEFFRAVMRGELSIRYADLADPKKVHYCGNYNGWVQLRKLVPGEADILGYRAALVSP